jgi:hypothetical protein
MSFYVSTAINFLLHCDEWDRFVAPPRHKFVIGATLLQLHLNILSWIASLLFVSTSFNVQIMCTYSKLTKKNCLYWNFFIFNKCVKYKIWFLCQEQRFCIILLGLGLRYLTPLSTIFQSYRGTILLFTISFLLLKKCKINS